MFLRLLFRKLGIAETKWRLAGVYGAIYGIIFFVLITLFETYLARSNLARNILLSVAVAVLLFAMYLIKWKLFYSKTKF